MMCERCYDTITSWSTSYFNTDTICHRCSKDERQAPGFAQAQRAEEEQVRLGNFNYTGVGLAPADRAFLAEQREKRQREKEENAES